MATNTSVLSMHVGSGVWDLTNDPSGGLNGLPVWDGAAWFYPALGWCWDGAAWQDAYSTPQASCATISGSATGATPTGSVTSSAAAPSPSGNTFGPLAWSWAHASGPGFSCSNPNSQTPTFSATVSAGTTTDFWNLTLTDQGSGATFAIANIAVQLTWTQNFSPFTQTFTGGQSGSTTVPVGATGVRRIIVGGGGYGGSGFFDVHTGDTWGGGGGGSGGVSDSGTVAVSSGEWGAAINYNVGQAGRNVGGNIATGSALSGHYSDSAGPGGKGGDASGAGVPGLGGSAGSPSGNAGSSGGDNAGGAPGAGFTFFATQYGGGTTGQAGDFPSDGEDGVIILVWT